MARVEKFEDLVAWQKARVLTRVVYETTSEPPMSGDRAFVNQMRRATVSVMANLAEGFERGTRGEFHQFLSMAKARPARCGSSSAGHRQKDMT
jgi:four helix bundle protein